MSRAEDGLSSAANRSGRRSFIFVTDRGVVRLVDLHVAIQRASEGIEGTPIYHAQQICLARVVEFFGGRC